MCNYHAYSIKVYWGRSNLVNNPCLHKKTIGSSFVSEFTWLEAEIITFQM